MAVSRFTGFALQEGDHRVAALASELALSHGRLGVRPDHDDLFHFSHRRVLGGLLGLFFTSAMDVQLLLGIVLYFGGSRGLEAIKSIGMKEVMGNSFHRFFAVEHITMMLIAIVLVHIGKAKSKKAATEVAKHKSAFWFYLIALLIMLAAIPWPFKNGFESVSWF